MCATFVTTALSTKYIARTATLKRVICHSVAQPAAAVLVVTCPPWGGFREGPWGVLVVHANIVQRGYCRPSVNTKAACDWSACCPRIQCSSSLYEATYLHYLPLQLANPDALTHEGRVHDAYENGRKTYLRLRRLPVLDGRVCFWHFCLRGPLVAALHCTLDHVTLNARSNLVVLVTHHVHHALAV